ncbi:MAG: PQQ-binding-like beta-propeller repeat protein [Thermoplasmata archaeon]|nr:MAG: PQQ-binding-like beta-propeller repeat protein [Thermoplasmata archaeon]
MRKLSVVFIILSIFFGIFTCVQNEEANAYKFRGNLHHIGVYESTVPDNNSLLWSFDTGSPMESSPVIVDDRVYFGSDNDLVYCLDSYTGKEIWNFTTKNSVKSTPAVVDGVVYVGSTDGNLYALDAETGDKLWNYSIPFAQIKSSPAVSHDKVFFGASDGNIYALNQSTHELEWSFPTGMEIQSSPAVDWPYIYIGSINGNVYCIWANNGTEKWTYESGGSYEIYSSPAISKGALFIAAGWTGENGAVFCLDAQTGQEIWIFHPPGWGRYSEVYSSPAVHNETVFIHAWYILQWGMRKGTLYALPEQDPNGDGNISLDEVKWSFTTWDYDGGSSPAVADGKVLVGCTERKLHCVNETTGEEIWNFTTGAKIHSSPSVANGIVYVTSLDGSIYAIGGGGPAILDIEILPEFSSIKANRVMGISFSVTYRGKPIEGAFINFAVSDGNLSQQGASTFPDGSQRVKYTSPKTDENITITVHATVTKFGYPEGESSVQFIVEPASSYGKVSTGSTISLSRYWFYIVLIVALIAINVIIVIVNAKRKGRIIDDKETLSEEA